MGEDPGVSVSQDAAQMERWLGHQRSVGVQERV